jgi:hypothetical protein
MKTFTLFIALAITFFLCALRVGGETGDIFKDMAHVAVGFALGAAYGETRTLWNGLGHRFWLVQAGILTVTEVIMATITHWDKLKALFARLMPVAILSLCLVPVEAEAAPPLPEYTMAGQVNGLSVVSYGPFEDTENPDGIHVELDTIEFYIGTQGFSSHGAYLTLHGQKCQATDIFWFEGMTPTGHLNWVTVTFRGNQVVRCDFRWIKPGPPA